MSEPGTDQLGTVMCWDNDDCPRDDCGGELQQQDSYNVQCLSCESVFSHCRRGNRHWLQDLSGEKVAEEIAADGSGEPGSEHSLLRDDRADAVLSEGREYRYSLTRTWNPEKPTLAWIMLNPSTADETEDDPTIRRCLGYAEDWGYGEIVVANLFALRATDPSELREHEAPVGEDNDEHLRRVCEDADRVVAAWGANGDLQNRGREVARTLDADLYALDTTKDGHPVHPLYQPGDAEPEPWDERALLAATDGGTESTGSEQQRDENECPECGSEGVPNPVLDDWYECTACVISFSADGEVDDEQR